MATELIQLLGPFVKAHDLGLVAGADGTVESTGPESVTRQSDADTLTGGDVLPGFAVPVAELFGGAYR